MVFTLLLKGVWAIKTSSQLEKFKRLSPIVTGNGNPSLVHDLMQELWFLLIVQTTMNIVTHLSLSLLHKSYNRLLLRHCTEVLGSCCRPKLVGGGGRPPLHRCGRRATCGFLLESPRALFLHMYTPMPALVVRSSGL